MIRSKRLQQLTARPDAARVHFDLGLRAYEEGNLSGVQRHMAALGMLPEAGVGSVAFMALEWRSLWLLDRREDALEVAMAAAARFPEDADTVLECGDVLNDLGRSQEALQVLAEGARHNADDADLWYEVGLAAEAVDDEQARLEAFSRVWELEHDQEPSHRLWLPEAAFVDFAEQAVERLPSTVRKALGNVAIFVDDYPEQWILETEIADPRVLGLFDGPERAVEAGLDYVASGPSRIYLYRWNIERACRSPEEVAEQVEITVLHEIGHYLGLDEEALDYRGLG